MIIKRKIKKSLMNTGEIDFVIQGKRFYLIESRFRNNKRFPKTIKNFIKNYSSSGGDAITIIVTRDLFSVEKNIVYIPAVCLALWKF